MGQNLRARCCSRFALAQDTERRGDTIGIRCKAGQHDGEKNSVACCEQTTANLRNCFLFYRQILTRPQPAGESCSSLKANGAVVVAR